VIAATPKPGSPLDSAAGDNTAPHEWSYAAYTGTMQHTYNMQRTSAAHAAAHGKARVDRSGWQALLCIINIHGLCGIACTARYQLRYGKQVRPFASVSTATHGAELVTPAPLWLQHAHRSCSHHGQEESDDAALETLGRHVQYDAALIETLIVYITNTLNHTVPWAPCQQATLDAPMHTRCAWVLFNDDVRTFDEVSSYTRVRARTHTHQHTHTNVSR
jgi:hypothetical protein